MDDIEVVFHCLHETRDVHSAGVGGRLKVSLGQVDRQRTFSTGSLLVQLKFGAGLDSSVERFKGSGAHRNFGLMQNDSN